MNWNEKVLEIMKQRNISQKELSKLSGITECSISRYLKNNQRPRLDIIVNIAKALNVTTEYLLNDEEKQESPFNTISTVVARYGRNLSAEEKNKLISIILGNNN